MEPGFRTNSQKEAGTLKLLKRNWLIVVAILLAVGIFAGLTLNRKDKTQYFTAKTERGDLREVVQATGTINAVTTVQVGSQVSGRIDKLYADFNTHVKKGMLVARIEPSLFEGALLQAKADLENAKASLAAAKANLEKAKAGEIQTKADYERIGGLTKQGIMSPQQLDLAKSNYDSAVAQVSAAQAQITQAAAQVQQRDAAVSVAQTNLDHTFIYAPIDGTVINRSVDVGQTVAASLQAPTLFTIAQDLTKMQVYAKTDESDVGMMKPGQSVTFKVDAFPKETFRGRVTQVRMNATTVQNVVTYDTIIDFDNPELKLFPGMTAYVTIPVATAEGVLKVPNGALRYKPDLPPDQLRALLAKYGIGEESGKGGQNGQRAARGQGGQGGGQGGGFARREAAGPGSDQSDDAAASKGPREPRLDIAYVWKLAPDKTLVPVQIRTGITDHTVTEVKQVLKGDLKDGEELVTGSTAVRSTATARPGGPMGGGMPRGR
jgi:HlyD family secretion protein